jgi:hypothetical protein
MPNVSHEQAEEKKARAQIRVGSSSFIGSEAPRSALAWSLLRTSFKPAQDGGEDLSQSSQNTEPEEPEPLLPPP